MGLAAQLVGVSVLAVLDLPTVSASLRQGLQEAEAVVVFAATICPSSHQCQELALWGLVVWFLACVASDYSDMNWASGAAAVLHASHLKRVRSTAGLLGGFTDECALLSALDCIGHEVE